MVIHTQPWSQFQDKHQCPNVMILVYRTYPNVLIWHTKLNDIMWCTKPNATIWLTKQNFTYKTQCHNEMSIPLHRNVMSIILCCYVTYQAYYHNEMNITLRPILTKLTLCPNVMIMRQHRNVTIKTLHNNVTHSHPYIDHSKPKSIIIWQYLTIVNHRWT
jgi:hypothetical protein